MYAPATPSQALLQPESSAIVFNSCRPRRIGKEASERTWKLDKTVPCEDGVERIDADELIRDLRWFLCLLRGFWVKSCFRRRGSSTPRNCL